MDDPAQIAVPVYDSADEYLPEPEPEPQLPAWCDGSVRIGIHTSIAGGIVESLESAQKLGCNALQIFSASPRMWPRVGARIPEPDAQRFRARRAELRLGPLAIHANYLINLGSADPVMRAKSIQAFHDEMVRAVAMGADFLVVHPGSCSVPQSSPGGRREVERVIPEIAQAIRQAARGVKFSDGAFHDYRRGGLRVLIENTSGMGAAVGSRFEELQAILEDVADVPVGVCLDTAHAFEAGYDIRSEAGLEQTLEALDRAVGLKRVAVVHTNDSKTPLGSRVDRHEHIGKGKIGLEAFRRILTHPKLSAASAQGQAGRAFLLETPIDAPGDDRRNVRMLWDLAGIPVQQAPKAQNGFSMRRAAATPNDSAAVAQQDQTPVVATKAASKKAGIGAKTAVATKAAASKRKTASAKKAKPKSKAKG